jgi:uncharacterized membrane protein
MPQEGLNDVSLPAYVWDATGKRRALGLVDGHVINNPRNLNDNGQALVSWGVPMDGGGHSDTSALVDINTGAKVTLSDQDPDLARTLNFAHRNNNAGQLIGTIFEEATQSLLVGVWTPGSGLNYLRPDAGKGALPSFGWFNNKGNVIGNNQPDNAPSPKKSFFWAAKTGYRVIASPQAAHPDLRLSAINDGDVAVGVISDEPSARRRPVIWSASTGVRVLSGSTSPYAEAVSINNQGHVVGRDHNAGGGFFWSALTGPKLLNTLLTGVPAGRSVVVTEAIKINNLNQILATGTINGAPHAMLLVPAP